MMNNIVGWIAWYTDGRVFSSLEYEWEDLPEDGVLIIKVFKDWISETNQRRNYRQHDGHDWYFWFKDTILSNTDSKKENKERYPGSKHFKRGKWTSDEEFKELSEIAAKTRWHDEPELQPCGGC